MDRFQHQQEYMDLRAHLPAWGLFWEQGTAKTRPLIETAGKLYRDGQIDGVLVVASDGVHSNFVLEELPKWADFPWTGHIWTSSKATTKAHAAGYAAALKAEGVAVLSMTYDGFMTTAGKKAAWAFLQKRRVLYAIDEAHNIKSPGAKRTKSIVASGVYAPYRRVLTGTPVTQSPFDVYSQVRFLDQDFWKRKGLGSYEAFKTHFGTWIRVETRDGRRFDKLDSYKNLDQLQGWLQEISNRVLKEDVLDLPPKLYTKRRFDMTAAQWRHYEELAESFMTELATGELVEAPLAIVRLLRFQQIACGYLPSSSEEGLAPIGNHNPRLEQMEAIRDDMHGKAIVWARFTQDIDQLMDLLGPSAVRYDGRVSVDQAERAKVEFQRGDARWFVGNQQKGSEGITLHAAKTMVYYSNNFRLRDRLQSEDRPHRAGMTDEPVLYIDLLANGTVDEGIIEALRNKMDIASQVTGDRIKEWI